VEEPRYIPATLADRIVGLHAVYAVTTALYHRERTGTGQAVEVPMFECMSQMILGDHFGGRSFDPPLGAAGYARVLAPQRKPFRTEDGYVCVLMYNDKQWQSFFRLIGRSDLYRDDPRFNSHENRSARIDEVNSFVAGEMLKRTTGDWLNALMAADIPAARMNTINDVIDDEHLTGTGFVGPEEHPTEGTLRTTRAATRWSHTPPAPQCGAPRLGEHGAEVLRAAGYSDEQIRTLAAAGVTTLPA
jgi:crotonobetainyl-CoA:carnitine CoA-transferase CaiB-like acyl-CoA transferase